MSIPQTTRARSKSSALSIDERKPWPLKNAAAGRRTVCHRSGSRCSRWRANRSKQQVPPLRSPGFPVEVGGFGELHAPFYGKAHTLRRPVQRGRKSGGRFGRDDKFVAGVELSRRIVAFKLNLSSRPERSVVEGPAVNASFTGLEKSNRRFGYHRYLTLFVANENALYDKQEECGDGKQPNPCLDGRCFRNITNRRG